MSYGDAEYREKYKNCPDGRLQDHLSVCDYCEGDSDYEDCPACNDTRKVRWGSWYRDENGFCEHCNDGVEKPYGRMFDGSSPDELDWICFSCYVIQHKKTCGCDLFSWADGIDLLKDGET